MKLKEFIKFNNTCPICAEPLTLYMQCNDNSLWKSVKRKDHFHFTPYKLLNHPFDKNDHLDLYYKDSINFDFIGPSTKKGVKTWNFNFFYLCNKSGLNIKGNYAYDINPYYGCYVRYSPWMEFRSLKDERLVFKDGAPNWECCVINPDHKELINVDENFCFKVVNNDLEKVYMLNFDFEESKTRLWFYTATSDQRNDEYYEPKLFDKEMPLISRPNFKNKEKFISRMDNWILMS